MSATKEIWILGAAGRCGRAIAAELAARQLPLVLVGRDRARLGELAATLGGAPRIVVAGSLDAIVTELSQGHPAVVVNTIGPFTETALPIARAGAPGSHYVDLSNELSSFISLLGLHDEAIAAGRCLVIGAGFGVLATESVVMKLCAGRPPAARVRVDAVPRIDGSGVLGPTLAASLVDGLAAGGRRYENGRLVRAPLAGDAERLTLPDGSTAVTSGVPSGDLEAARRASGASFAVAGSSEVPSTPLTRVLLPALAALLSWRVVRDAAKSRLARMHISPPAKPREFSFTHARVQWPDGSIREGWLRAGEGMAFTAKSASEIAARLAGNRGRPGAYTPGALFGPELAVQAGAQFILGR
jgi:short subunit dehydrogenase-like uncharacterized protein